MKTVFVIGAGASKEVNLPTGFELKEKISELLDITFDWHDQKSGDYVICQALRRHVKEHPDHPGNINPYLEEAWHIRDALPQAISIDNFIDAHRENEMLALCGKLAIVRSILEAERNSLLFFERTRVDSTVNFTSLGNTWYIPFFQLLTENCGINDIEERLSNVALIVFNYDRCIEHFLKSAFQNYYRFSEEESANIVNSLEIYHPYGSVGLLPWQARQNTVDFGVGPNSDLLLRLAKDIKTFTEGTDPNSSEICAIRSHMSSAQRLVFLGFAFHKLNMQLIAPGNIDDFDGSKFKCFSTTLGISESDKEVISEQVGSLYDKNLKTRMANVTCKQLFTEFWRSLSF